MENNKGQDSVSEGWWRLQNRSATDGQRRSERSGCSPFVRYERAPVVQKFTWNENRAARLFVVQPDFHFRKNW